MTPIITLISLINCVDVMCLFKMKYVQTVFNLITGFGVSHNSCSLVGCGYLSHRNVGELEALN